MKAIIRDAYGSVDALRLADIDQPVAGEVDVLVHVHAAGVDQGVWHLMTGTPYAMRLAGFGIRAPKNALLGYDVAGRIEAVGAQVTEFRPGQAVFGTCRGSFAEYAVARADRLLPKPENVTFEQAAVVPISGFAALQAVREQGGVRSGQRVLIIGAGGGVGTFAVQIAKADGAEVTGVCSASKAELVRSIGADHVIDYTREDFVDGRNRYDVILDIAGNRSLSELRRAFDTAGDTGDRRRRGRGQMARHPPSAARRRTLALRPAEAWFLHLEGASGGPGGTSEAARSGHYQASRRQDVPARRGACRDPVP